MMDPLVNLENKHVPKKKPAPKPNKTRRQEQILTDTPPSWRVPETLPRHASTPYRTTASQVLLDFVGKVADVQVVVSRRILIVLYAAGKTHPAGPVH